MHKRGMILAVMCFSMLAGILGCSESGVLIERETLLDQNWGRAYETAKYNQMLNPDASKNLNPVQGLDGIASDHSTTRYENSFKESKDKQTVNILKLQ